MVCDLEQQCSHCQVLHSFPWCSLGTCWEALPRQSPVLWQSESVLETIPVGTLGVDTLCCRGKSIEPHGSDSGCPAWLSTRDLLLACSLSNHSQEQAGKGLEVLPEIVKSMGRENCYWLAIGKWKQNPWAFKLRSWTLNLITIMSFFYWGLKKYTNFIGLATLKFMSSRLNVCYLASMPGLLLVISWER